MLTQIPYSDEILEVFRSMPSDSAPGLDGFPGSFYVACWDIIKGDIFAVVQSFVREGTIPKAVNSSFIALIPKKSKSKSFRTI